MVPYIQIWGGVGNPENKSEQDMITGVKDQSGLGFSWASRRFEGMENFQRPWQGSHRASFRHGLIRDQVPFPRDSLSPSLLLTLALSPVLQP